MKKLLDLLDVNPFQLGTVCYCIYGSASTIKLASIIFFNTTIVAMKSCTAIVAWFLFPSSITGFEYFEELDITFLAEVIMC